MTRFEPGITVVIPTIPPRAAQLERASRSVMSAFHYLAAHSEPLGLPANFALYLQTVQDTGHNGAAVTRHAGLRDSFTTYTAFLDDDDEMLPHHLFKLLEGMLEHGADFAWSRFLITYPDGSVLPGPAFLGKKAFSPWNDDDPCETTITTMVNTGLAQACGGFIDVGEDGEVQPHQAGEDHKFALRMRLAGAEFFHVAEVTWRWHHWGTGKPGLPGNTSGMPDRW